MVVPYAQALETATDVVLAVHGGTGVARKDLTPEKEKLIRAALEQSLKAGWEKLQKGGSSLDAVETAVRVLEDSPYFNAGKGAVFTFDGKNELDASIMDGKDRRAGAVAGVTTVKNPIRAARAVMEKSEHVFLVGPPADAFAKAQGIEIVDPSYFRTEERWKELEAKQKKKGEWGTVGAVALDRAGNLAAATSTGGMTGKRWGRVGDSPIVGAGTWAENETCAVSSTGHGEYFIRIGVAHDIAARIRYAKQSLSMAVEAVIQQTLKKMGGEGGVVALDAQGHYASSHHSDGLYRGWVTKTGTPHVRLYRD